MSNWVSVAGKSIVASVMRSGPHRMSKRILHWTYCAQCGLLNLRNEATRLALRRECRWEDD